LGPKERRFYGEKRRTKSAIEEGLSILKRLSNRSCSLVWLTESSGKREDRGMKRKKG